MKRKLIGKNGRQIVTELRDRSSTSPWLSAHKIGAHHGYRTDGAEQAQRTPAVTPLAQDRSGKLRGDQLAALNTWEDEGGSTAAPVKAVGTREPASK